MTASLHALISATFWQPPTTLNRSYPLIHYCNPLEPHGELQQPPLPLVSANFWQLSTDRDSSSPPLRFCLSAHHSMQQPFPFPPLNTLKSSIFTYLNLPIGKTSSFQENVPYDVVESAASRICLFPSPFLRESGGDDVSLHDARNFVARH